MHRVQGTGFSAQGSVHQLKTVILLYPVPCRGRTRYHMRSTLFQASLVMLRVQFQRKLHCTGKWGEKWSKRQKVTCHWPFWCPCWSSPTRKVFCGVPLRHLCRNPHWWTQSSHPPSRDDYFDQDIPWWSSTGHSGSHIVANPLEATAERSRRHSRARPAWWTGQ